MEGKEPTKDLATMERVTEVLKERIYANLALLAVLVSIRPEETTHAQAALLIGGTAISLWFAGLFATRTARLIVLKEKAFDSGAIYHELAVHSPLLLSAIVPLLLISLSALGVMSLSLAIQLSTYLLLLLMIVWSVLSARALRASAFRTFIVAVFGFLIGLFIVGLKILAGH